MPVNYWRLSNGEWIQGADLGTVDVAYARDAALSDGERYNAMGCTAWIIACPECRKVYAGEVTG
jgi:hypothetical protein